MPRLTGDGAAEALQRLAREQCKTMSGGGIVSGAVRICPGPDCTREAGLRHGLCQEHRAQQRRGRPLTPIRKYQNTADILDDIQLMRDTGEHPERAAERLGMTPAALSRALYRHGSPWPALEAAVARAQRVQRAER